MKKFTSIYKKSKNISKQIEIEYFFVGMRTETPKKSKKVSQRIEIGKIWHPTPYRNYLYIQYRKNMGSCKMGVGVGVPFLPTFSFTLLYYTIIIRYFIIYPIQ